MLIGYMRVSKADGSQSTDLQRDALRAAGVTTRRLYEDRASGRLDARPGLDAALKALRRGDTLIVWKLDRLGRDLRHLINVVHDLSTRGIGFKVLTGHGASIDTTTPAGKLVFGIFAALAEFERDLISERTKAGLASARARGRAIDQFLENDAACLTCGSVENDFQLELPYRGEDTIRTLKHAKQPRRSHVHGCGAAEIHLDRGSAMCPSGNRRLD